MRRRTSKSGVVALWLLVAIGAAALGYAVWRNAEPSEAEQRLERLERARNLEKADRLLGR